MPGRSTQRVTTSSPSSTVPSDPRRQPLSSTMHRPRPTDAPPAPPDASADVAGDGTQPSSGPQPAERGRSLPARIGMRIIRRPYQWLRRPWPDDRVVRLALTVSTLVVTTFIMMRVVHLRPILGDDLIFDDVTPTGGDMGSHVWAPAYLRDHLLSNFQLSGWSMDWYGGLPVYRFYMVIPALAIVALDTFLPYGVAFKLVAISGLVTLPFTCWAFGRLGALPLPVAGTVRLRRAVLRPQREHDDLRGQRAGDDGRRVLVLDRHQPDDARTRPARPGPRRRQGPADDVGVDRPRPGVPQPRHRADLHGDRRAGDRHLSMRRRPLAAARQPHQPAPFRRRWRPGPRVHRAGHAGPRRPGRAAHPGLRPIAQTGGPGLAPRDRRHDRPLHPLRLDLAAQPTVRQAAPVRRVDRRPHPAPRRPSGSGRSCSTTTT